MIIDNIKLIDGSIQNAVVESGTALPAVELTTGRIFFLTQVQGPNNIGLYIYSGAEWVLFSSSEYVDTRIAEIVGTAPETLNSLAELADALGEDPDFILTINTKIDNEETRALAAETQIANDLTLEATRATTAEAELQSDIDTEVAARQASDANLQTQIDDEVTARTSADTSFQQQINDEISARTSADATKVAKAGDAMTGFLTLHADPTSNLHAATKAYVDAKKALSDGDVSAEATARASADATLQNNIDNEVTRATGVESSLSTAISDEATRATAAEGSLQSQLDTEVSERQSSDVTLQGAIDSEVSTRTASDANLQSQIDAISGTGGSAESETTARIAADNALSDRIDDADNAISSEVSDRIASDTVLQSAISDEETARIAADSTLQDNIDAVSATANSKLGATAKAVDSDKLDGLNSTDFLRSNAKAVDSDKLDGNDSSQFLRSDVNDTMSQYLSLSKTPTSDAHAAHKKYVDDTINAVVNAAPGTLDTLNELAAALGDDPNFATTITNQIAAEETARIAADSTLQDNIDAVSATANSKLGATAKAVDSDKLDGINSSQFLRSDVNDTMSQYLSLSKTPTSGAHAANKTYVDGKCDTIEANYTKRIVSTKTANYTVPASQQGKNIDTVLFVDTSGGARTITLPASPAVGCKVSIVDANGTFGTNGCTVDRNNLKIMGISDNLLINNANASATLIYSGSANGWRLVY